MNTAFHTTGRPLASAQLSTWARSPMVSSVLTVASMVPSRRSARTLASSMHVSLFMMSVTMGVPS
jgi:hypothetical protein